jgi:hypothetical protein
MPLFTDRRPRGLGWTELRFFGGPADGSRTYFRHGRGISTPSPRMLIRDPAVPVDSPRRSGEMVHVYLLSLGPNGRDYYHYVGREALS